MLNFFKKIFSRDALAKDVGKVENVIRHPLYPIKAYQDLVDGNLSRGSWPTRKELKVLKQAGFKVIINLCSERDQDADVRAAGMVPHNIPFPDNTYPWRDQVADFIEIVKSYGPAFVHCEQGRGRTGCMVAAYRVLVNGWTPNAALKEAQRFGLELTEQKKFILGLEESVCR